MPRTKRPRSRRGWRAVRIGMCIFTPTSASWLNRVERWFAELTRKQIRRGVHRSVAELEAGITAFIDAHNESQKPCRWLKSAAETLAAVNRFCQKTTPRTSDSGGLGGSTLR